MPEKRTLPVRDEHAPPADRPVYPGRHRGRRLLGVDAYGFGHYRAGDWVEIVRHVAVVDDGDDGRGPRRERDARRESDADRRPEGRRDREAARHEPGDVPYERAATRRDPADEDSTPHDSTPHDSTPHVETDLVTVHEVPLHLLDVSLDEYLRSVGDFLGPVAELGFQPVEGADPDRWEWVSPYARRWVEAFGDGDGPSGGSDAGASA